MTDEQFFTSVTFLSQSGEANGSSMHAADIEGLYDRDWHIIY